jgi:hypothetical protein
LGIDNAMTYAVSRAAFAILCLPAVTGCDEIAFKRGSGPDAFVAARAACREQNAEPAAIRACLSQAGWHVAALDAAAYQTVPAPRPVAPDETSAPSVPVEASGPASPVPAQAVPSGTLSIGSWWKFGAGAADLRAAAEACAAGLSLSDRPEPGYHHVTPALYACLRDHGWHGIGRTNS